MIITFIAGITLFITSLVIAVPAVYKTLSDALERSNNSYPNGGTESLASVDTFTSADEFRKYIDISNSLLISNTNMSRESVGMGMPESSYEKMDDVQSDSSPSNTPDRYSTTNVQVSGIDEPDIVKTDGKSIYFSPEQYWYLYDLAIEDSSGSFEDGSEFNPDLKTDTNVAIESEPSMNEAIPRPDQIEPTTHVVTAFPPESLAESSSISGAGDLLLVNDILMILNYDKIQAFDVSDTASPTSLWDYKTNENTSITTSRLYGDSLYVVTQQYTDYGSPCPIEPLLRGKDAIVSIKCSDIYHPTSYIETDSTYSVLKIEPETGKVLGSTSFVASSGSSVVYMSNDNLYLTYTYASDYSQIFLDFLLENDDLFTKSVIERIKIVDAYELSSEAKLVELQSIISQLERSLQDDARIILENELQNRMSAFLDIRKRELQFTGIAKIGIDTLEVAAVGSVPGYPLNQFALDEYNGNLRVATTVGGGWWWVFGTSSESANDIYVLNNSMKTIGSVKDLGLNESIYSVRFIRDAAYVVTYLQVDPFYIVDLSNPHSPEVKGELAIPGYSSYLHPLDETMILGVGQEDSHVKLSIFDVSNATVPREISKYILSEYWTEVNSNHHAFMIDPEYKIFFLPAGSRGFIFAYEGGSLKPLITVSNIQARRALYIDGYLYIVGDEKIVVLDENTWEQLPGELVF